MNDFERYHEEEEYKRGLKIAANDNRRKKLNGAHPPAAPVGTTTSAALQTMVFPPLRYLIPNVIPEGVSLLVSRPKLGKSWLALDIGIAVAAGRFVLGDRKPEQGPVLYVALEDGLPRLQRRMAKLLRSDPDLTWPPGLEFATDCPRAGAGGLEFVANWCKARKDPRLVIVDTLAMFRDVKQSDSYATDYAALTGLQAVGAKHRLGIMVAHHDRKAEAEDVFDTISGTLGLSGAADTVIILKRHAGGAIMSVRGRDVEQLELLLQWNTESCRWTILGDAAEAVRSKERNAILAVLGEGEMSVKDICNATGFDRNATDRLLFSMVKDREVNRTGRGKYTPR